MTNHAKIPDPVEVIRRRRTQLLTARGYVSLGLRILVIILTAWLVFSNVFLISQCSDLGMFPAIEGGDLILAYRLQGEYAKGDVVIYTVDGTRYLGRIAARETDVVMLDDSGNLVVNGTTQGGEIMYPTYAKEGIRYPLTVPANALFVLGDYRTQTQDSRDFGPIPLDDVEGKVITIIRRRGI